VHLWKIYSKISDVLVGQIANHTAGENAELVRAGAAIGEELSRESRIGEVGADALEPAARLLACEPRLFQLDHVREIDLDPAERVRQVDAVGPRIEPGAEIEDGVDACGDRLPDVIVDDHGADHDRPGAEGPRHDGQDLLAMLADELRGKRSRNSGFERSFSSARKPATMKAVSETFWIVWVMGPAFCRNIAPENRQKLAARCRYRSL